jgi:hypothetical protein
LKETFRGLAGMLFALVLAFPAGAATVEGTLRYEKLPVSVRGLDLTQPVPTPAPQVHVMLRRTTAPTSVVAEGDTDEGGRYRLEVPDGTGQVVLLALAISGQVSVHDPRNGAFWVYESPAFDAARAPQTVTIPDRDRRAGPFNILAAIHRTNRFLRALEPGLPLDQQQITIYWSPVNRTGTYFDVLSHRAFILGDRDEDSDEFDDSVIIHEYAHYLARRYSRDDSPGGAHCFAERLDPRLAWSEGWANFFAQAVLGDPRYIDTLGPDGSEVLAFDLDEDVADGDSPGYWSEDSVASVLWDLYAEPGTGTGHLGIGMSPIWRALREYFPSQVFPYLLTLADGLIQQDPSRQQEITNLLAKREIRYRYGVVPSVEQPFPRLLQPGAPATGQVRSFQAECWTLLDASDYYRFRITTERDVQVRLRLTGADRDAGPADLVLVLYDAQARKVAVVDQQHGEGSVERLSRRLPPGDYVIGVQSFLQVNEDVRYGQGRYELTAEF